MNLSKPRIEIACSLIPFFTSINEKGETRIQIDHLFQATDELIAYDLATTFEETGGYEILKVRLMNRATQIRDQLKALANVATKVSESEQVRPDLSEAAENRQ